MALPLAAAETKPETTPQIPLLGTVDQSPPLDMLSPPELLLKAHELMDLGEADNQQCIVIAKQALTEHGAQIGPDIVVGLVRKTIRNFPDTNTLPKAPNQRSHPSMSAEDRAVFRDRHKTIVNIAKNMFSEQVEAHEPALKIDYSILPTDNRLGTTLGEIKKELRAQVGDYSKVIRDLSPSLLAPGKMRKSAAKWVVGKFGLQEPRPKVEVRNGNHKDLEQALLGLIKTLEILGNPETLGEQVAIKHTPDMAGKIRDQLLPEYERMKETAFTHLTNQVTKLLEEAEQLSGGRVRKTPIHKKSKPIKPEKLPVTEPAQPFQEVPPDLGSDDLLAGEAKLPSRPRAPLPNDLPPKQIISALKRVGLVPVPGGGKGDHQKMNNPATGVSANIHPGMSRNVLSDRLGELGVDPNDFRSNLRGRKFRIRGRL